MTVRVDLLRPDDLLAITVEAVNLRLDTSNPELPRLVRETSGQPSYLVFHFAPQTIVEEAFFEAAQVRPPQFNPPAATPPLDKPPPLPSMSDKLVPPGATKRRMGGPSRVVFQLPMSLDGVTYSIAALLEWSQLEVVLPPAATILPDAAPGPGQTPPAITEPDALHTALELPYRLIVAPNVLPDGSLPAWVHAQRPVAHAGRVELWHTRLARRDAGSGVALIEANASSPMPLRVVWSPDFVDSGPLPSHLTDNLPFRAPMTGRDRDQIVILSAGFVGYTLTDLNGTDTPYVPGTTDATRLFLSSLGGWLSSRGSWRYPVSYRYTPSVRVTKKAGTTSPAAAARVRRILPAAVAGLDLVEWEHVATQGRDHYVRIVYEGFLFPFGHRASLVKVTERKVLTPHGTAGNPADSPVAYLRQRMYIVVRERDKSYVGEPYLSQGREMPMASLVRIQTAVTPEIDPPAWISGTSASFWVMVNTQPFQFHLNGRDLAGHSIDFLAPLVFVSLSEDQPDNVPAEYVKDNGRRRCVVRGRNVTYADPSTGDTELKTNALYFSAQVTKHQPPYPKAPFLPTLDRAAVTVPALSALIGEQTAVLIRLDPSYLASGMDAHAGVFASLAGGPQPVAFSADRAGGFAQPNIALSALSARKGLVSGKPEDAVAGLIRPADYFGAADAKLFGTIALRDLIPVDGGGLADAGPNAPEVRTTAVPDRTNPKQLVTLIDWSPHLKSYKLGPVSISFDDGGQSQLKVHVRIETNLDGTPPTSTSTSTLTHFVVELAGVIGLAMHSITFESASGAKPKVALDLAPSNAIRFIGPLQFVQTLADILPSGLFGGMGPSIALTSSSLRVSYTLGLPPLTTGVFSLQNIAITAGLELPFSDGKPSIEFAFCSRSSPFLLTVEIFGGGGFVHVVLDTDGVRLVEGSLEFGGNFALNIGVASGGVHAMAGIYFQLKDTSSDLTGFVDVGGEVSVLGLVSVSIDLNISLSWQSSAAGNIIQGRATMIVAVSIAFFSTSVSLSVERSFSAGGGDPKVDQMVTAQQWAEYARAFA